MGGAETRGGGRGTGRGEERVGWGGEKVEQRQEKGREELKGGERPDTIITLTSTC